MKKFDYKKFLVENKLTIDSRNINEMNLYNLKDLPSDVEWQEGGTADTGTDNPLGAEPSERESYDVQVFGYSPSTGKSYEGLAGGSYGETDFDTIDNIEEIPNERNPYYRGEKSNMREASLAGNKRDELIDYLAEELEYMWKMGKDDTPKNFKRISRDLIGYLENELSIKDEMDEGNSDSTSKGMFAVEKPNGEVVKHLNSEKEAQDYIDKIDPEGMIDFNIRKV